MTTDENSNGPLKAGLLNVQPPDAAANPNILLNLVTVGASYVVK